MTARLSRATAAALVAAAGLAATGGSAAPAATPGAAPRPSITIVSPKAGATVHGRAIRVTVAVRSFNPRGPQFSRPVAGEGHVHFYLDVATLPRTHMYPSPVRYRSVSGTTYAWVNVQPGRHTVAVQLVGNDHVPLRPPTTARLTVTVH